MSEPITIPGDLHKTATPAAYAAFLEWLLDNGIEPNAIPASRPLIVRGDVIEYWEVVPRDAEDAARDFPAGASRREHELSPGEEWTTDDEFAKAIRLAKDELRIPLPDDLRAALV